MSRIGNKIINIPDGVSFDNKDSHLKVKGPNGNLTVNICDEVSLKIEDNTINFTRKSEDLLSVSRLLESVSYKKVLSRGYSVIRDEDEKIVSSKSQLKGKSAITIEWSDGKINVTTDK